MLRCAAVYMGCVFAPPVYHLGMVRARLLAEVLKACVYSLPHTSEHVVSG